MNNNIKLNSGHNDAKRMEFFLNGVKEELIEVAFDWRILQLADHIENGYKFTSFGEHPITITALLCTSYQDANEIAKANMFPVLSTSKWGVNGDLLYIVESTDKEKVSDILSYFAGEE
jgi:hypothetical protein